MERRQNSQDIKQIWAGEPEKTQQKRQKSNPTQFKEKSHLVKRKEKSPCKKKEDKVTFQKKREKSPCFQICCLPRRCILVHRPSSPLWKDKDEKKLKKSTWNPPNGKAGHQAGGGVGFDDRKPLGVAVNLPAPLELMFLKRHRFISSIDPSPCARR